MTEQKIEPLSTGEYDLIEKALLDLVRQYPAREGADPDVVAQWDGLEAGKSLSVSAIGGRVKKRDVLGGFTAEVSFRVAYKSNPTSSQLRMNAQAFVGRIMAWLEQVRDLPRLTGRRTITKITASPAIPYMDETGQDKSTVYAADAVMEYEAD